MCFCFFRQNTPSIRLSLQWTEGEDAADKKTKKGQKDGGGILKIILKEAKCLPLKPDGDVPSVYCKVYVDIFLILYSEIFAKWGNSNVFLY